MADRSIPNLRDTAVLHSILGAIGQTPLVNLSRLTGDVPGRILAKLEYLSPGHSKKDRIALAILEAAASRGELVAGQTVVEMTSGNTGTGVAIVCAVKGYPFVAVMSAGNSSERVRMMRAFGAEVVLVDQAAGGATGLVRGEDLNLVEAAARRLAKERHGFLVDQFVRNENAIAHQEGTAIEILEQTGGELHAFCDFVGTGGSFAGCAAALKQHNPAIGCYVIEPAGAELLAGKPAPYADHPIQGGGYSRELPLIDRALIDGFLAVGGDEAKDWARRLAREEGIFGGFSAGANVAAARQLLEGELTGKTIVTMICDSGLKYLSTDLWADP